MDTFKKFHFYIVGVGGTGSLLARDLIKMLIDTKHTLTLIDGDMVEEKNIRRQSYQLQDVGHNKAIMLASKINSLYSTDCRSVDKYITKNELRELMATDISKIPVIIGCVDNDATRKLLEDAFKQQRDAVYIDSANSEYEGNVYVSVRLEGQQAGKLRSEVYALKNDKNPTDRSCQELQSAGSLQYLVTNAKMATCILEHCFNLIQSDEKKLVGVTKIGRFEEIHFE